MPSVAQLLNTVSRPNAQQQGTGGGLMDALSEVGGVGLGAVASVGNFLDLPGSSIRDVLAGENPFDQWMTPLSDVNRTTGRQLLEQYGMRKNKESGIMGWFSDPGEGLRDVAGFATEVLLDPFGPAVKAAAGVKAIAPAVSMAGRAHPTVKAIGRGAQYVFDKLPEAATRAVTDRVAGAGRLVKSIFNKHSEGITDASVMPYVENARVAADAWRFKAGVYMSELATTANNNGFNLVPNEALDLSDPANLLKDDSLYRVRNREDQISRAFEGVYDPESTKIQQRDLVTIGDGSDIREVEFIDNTPTGRKVKLVGDDNMYNDWDINPSFTSVKEVIPQPVLDVVERIRQDYNAIKTELAELGYDHGELVDPAVEFAHRRKSNELRQAEEILGESAPSWVRNTYRSLAETLAVKGGRELKYRTFKDGRIGVNNLHNDKGFQKIVEHISERSVPVTKLGVTSSVLPNHVGVKHVAGMAKSLDMDPTELWEEIVRLVPVTKTGTVAYTTEPGIYDIVNGSQRVGQVGVRMIDDIAEIAAPALPADTLDDAFQYVEHDLATKGTTRVDVMVTPETADVLKKRGYLDAGLNEDGSEIWSKPLYTAGKMYIDRPLMLPVEEFKDKVKKWYDLKVEQFKAGDEPGVRYQRGRWKSWTDLRPSKDGTERVMNFNFDPNNPNDFKPLDLATLDASRHMLENVEDYDIARAALEAGKEVYTGRKVIKRGSKAEFLMVTPTIKAQVEGRFKKLMEGIDDTIGADPLSAKDAIYDHVHRAITRNYSEDVDQWMPKLGERGTVEAVSADGAKHSASINRWHSLFSETVEAGERLNNEMKMLLRLDDPSLKALMFTDGQVEELAKIRQAQLEGVETESGMMGASELIEQDASIELVDRHRALAMDVGDKVERRYIPLYARSSGIDQGDYITRNGMASEVLKATRDYIANSVKAGIELDAAGVGKLSTDLQVKYDPAVQRGMTLADAIDKGFFPERLNTNRFLENVRQKLVADGTFPATDEASKITLQMNAIRSLRLPSKTWGELKSFNEFGTGSLPELGQLQKVAGSLNAILKSGLLAISPATAIRDGMSSFIQASVMGGMNPVTAAQRFGKKALSFVRGSSVDPGEGIKEIDAYLAMRNLPNNAQTRGEAFQNMWNSYTMHGSLHPNVVTADAARMAETEFTASALANAPSKTIMQDVVGGVKRTVLHPIKSLSPTHIFKEGNVWNLGVPGTWKLDELGRPVQRSASENPIVGFNNGLRGILDGTIRSMYVMDRAAKTKSLTDAFAAADKFLLNADPAKFTRFENTYMKSYITFYSFMRQSIPLFMSELLANPGGKLGMTVRASRLGQGGSDQYVPYQYLDSAAIPLGESDEGELRYLTSFGLMHEDAIKYAGNILQGDSRALMQQVTSSAHPLIKWWVEHSTNTSLFSQGPMGGRRLDDLDPNIGRILSNVGLQDPDASGRATPFLGSPVLESLAAAGPASRVLSMTKTATDKRAGALSKVFRLMTGVRAEYVTQEMVTRDLRDRLNAIQIAAGARPLTTVSGTEKLQEHLEATGQLDKLAVLKKISDALAVQRKTIRDREKPKKQSLIDMLQQAR